MASYGLTAAGFVVKPLSAIIASLQQAVWSSPLFGPDFDLTPQTPDGQMLGIFANELASNWELLQIVDNQYNRADAEGASLDNLGDVIGVPREGVTRTQVYCTCTLSAGNAPYAAGSLVANINGQPSQTFSNVTTVTAAMISGGTATVLFQSTSIGPTPAVNPGTLTQITTPVTGWTAVTNPAGQSQLGVAEETDALYGPRQGAEVALEGSCDPAATAAAIEQLGASQQPPVNLTASIVENTGQTPLAIAGTSLTLQPHQYAVFVYDPTTWLGTSANQQALGQLLYNNKPAGNTMVGTTPVTITDPTLGQQVVSYTPTTQLPLFLSATIAIRPGFVWATVQTAIQAALIAAAVAPTPSNGVPPVGQLIPGAYVIGSQLEAVIMGVPGVFDVQTLTFGFSAGPTNTAPLAVPASSVATIVQGNVGNLVLTQGGYP